MFSSLIVVNKGWWSTNVGFKVKNKLGISIKFVILKIFMDNIFEWGESFIQCHFNCTFAKFEQTIYKKFKIEKNDRHIYTKLHNIKQKDDEWVEVYYEIILRCVANCLHIKLINTYLTIFFKIGLHPYI
jgi:hypothetical protein